MLQNVEFMITNMDTNLSTEYDEGGVDQSIADGKMWKVSMTSGLAGDIELFYFANSAKEAFYKATNDYPTCKNIEVRKNPVSKEEYYKEEM